MEEFKIQDDQNPVPELGNFKAAGIRRDSKKP